jgi:hypothetical protein
MLLVPVTRAPCWANVSALTSEAAAAGGGRDAPDLFAGALVGVLYIQGGPLRQRRRWDTRPYRLRTDW